jgi:single-strand DNA-binding protein
MNIIILAGRIGNVEGKTTANGSMVCNASLATNRVWYDKQDGKQEETTWHRLVIWGKSSDSFVQHVKKGDGVVIHGRLTEDEWTDKDGNKRRTAKVVVDRWEFGQGSSNRQGSRESHSRPPERRQNDAPAANQGFDQSFSDDDIPFAFPFQALEMGV